MINIFICPVNGRSKVGKDTFVNEFGKLVESGHYTVDHCMVAHISAVKYLKEAMPLLINEEYNGEFAQRTFLYNLLNLVNSYKSISKILLEKIYKICTNKAISKATTKIFFIDMRDPDDINELRDRVAECISTEFIKGEYVNFIFKTIIIENKNDDITNPDDWDKKIFDMDYDYRIDNSGTIEDLKSEAFLLLKDFMEMRPLISFRGEHDGE